MLFRSVRAELERARLRLLETVERCRQGDELSHARREEALRFAKEVRESAAREGSLAQSMASHEAEVARHQALVRRADERLAKRKADQDAEHQERLQAARATVTADYSAKLKKQEERFRRKHGEDERRIKELEAFNATLQISVRRYRSARDRANEAREKTQADLDSLAADMRDLSQQVGPVAAQAEARHQREETARLLGVQRDRMFRELVERARRAADSLGVDSPPLPVEGNSDVATYLAFFNELLRRFEGAAAEFEGLIDEASRNLLEVAVQRLFSNLRRHYPAVDLEVITALEVEDDQAREISRAVAGAVTAFAERFKRPVEGESSSEEDGEESAEGGEGDGADDSA